MTDPLAAPPQAPLDLGPIKAREAAATTGPWAWGRLIGDQAGDYVVWLHRGERETSEQPATGYSGQGPQRTYIGNVGSVIQPVIEADVADVFANQIFDTESADAAFIAHARSDIPALIAEISRLQEAVAASSPPAITGETSDGYHTFNELYGYRKAYNALLFNEWAGRGIYDVHKSWHHSDGEPCFGGGWFVVVAQTPAGQITNHYKSEDWPMFRVAERDRADVWDGHTPAVALERLLTLAVPRLPQEPTENDER